jgi:short-subunit dehydrogenase
MKKNSNGTALITGGSSGIGAIYAFRDEEPRRDFAIPILKHILEKLGATDRTHATTIAARRGFIHL